MRLQNASAGQRTRRNIASRVTIVGDSASIAVRQSDAIWERVRLVLRIDRGAAAAAR
jgi:hypothetical protein